MAACVKSYLIFLPGGNLLVLKWFLFSWATIVWRKWIWSSTWKQSVRWSLTLHSSSLYLMQFLLNSCRRHLMSSVKDRNTEVKIEKKEWGSEARNEEARLTSSLASSPWLSLVTVSEQSKSFTLACDQWYWWTYFLVRNREADVENGLVDRAGEGECGMNWESSTDSYTLSCVK